MFKSYKDEWIAFGCASALTFSLLYATIAGLNVFNEIRLTASELNSEMSAFKVCFSLAK